MTVRESRSYQTGYSSSHLKDVPDFPDCRAQVHAAMASTPTVSGVRLLAQRSEYPLVIPNRHARDMIRRGLANPEDFT
ncbi:hypothetical protein Kisp02_54590 [Kineosporia sp. NBRC 101731]|nr:hypothetical protein Kisp02_54590 [Kineosporia sp. NBRC 101731]